MQLTIDHIVSSSKESTFHDMCQLIIEEISRKDYDAFEKVAEKKGLHITRKLNAYKAAAMWTDANVSMRSAKVILKHLRAKLGLTIQVPMTEVTKLGKISDDIEPVFGSYCCKQNNDDSDQTEKSEEVITENVSFWSYDFCDLMELDFE